MAEIAVVYASIHHDNTKKLLEGIAQSCDMDLFPVALAKDTDFTQYRAVGFASGIYFSQIHQSLRAYLDGKPSLPQNTFAICTSGSGGERYTQNFSALLKNHGLQVLGGYQCKGYDTYGPFKLVGGIAKGHPNQEDVAGGLAFVRDVLRNL